MKTILAAALLSLLAGLVSAAVSGGESAEFELTQPKQRLQAPEFTLDRLDAQPVSLEKYRGKVVLVHFWGTFCGPCLDEMPALETLWRQYREDGLVVLGIAADRGSDSVIREFTSKTGVTFPVLQDKSGNVRNRYEVMALPTSYLVGRDGRISARAIGTQAWDSPEAREYIESIL